MTKFESDLIGQKFLLRIDCKSAKEVHYVGDFYKNMAFDCKPLFERLKKNPPERGIKQTEAVRKIKAKVKEIPCLALIDPEAFKIIETDASELGYGGILKQRTLFS